MHLLGEKLKIELCIHGWCRSYVGLSNPPEYRQNYLLIQQNLVYLDRVFPSVEGGRQRVSMYVLWGI